jgi:Transglycosylase SLT domain
MTSRPLINNCAKVLAQVLLKDQFMIHKLLCATLTFMCVAVTVMGQDLRHDGLLLQERMSRLEPHIAVAAVRHRVDARILRAICFIESRYRIGVVSQKGARGPMQFMPGTAARYGLRDPHNPEQAIDAAARYLRDLLKKFDGRVDLALAAYNAGEGTVTSFRTGKPLTLSDGRIVNARGVVTGGIPPYAETQRYVRSVLALLNNDVTRPLGGSNPRFHFETRRDLSLDVLDISERMQKKISRRASSFIEVP